MVRLGRIRLPPLKSKWLASSGISGIELWVLCLIISSTKFISPLIGETICSSLSNDFE